MRETPVYFSDGITHRKLCKHQRVQLAPLSNTRDYVMFLFFLFFLFFFYVISKTNTCTVEGENFEAQYFINTQISDRNV